MKMFMLEHLESSRFYDEVMGLGMVEIDLDNLQKSGEEILNIIENERNVDFIDDEISRYIENIDATVPKEQGAWIYSSVAYVALYTYQLWSNEWDYIERSVVPESILYCIDNKEEKQEGIKKADIKGAVHGACTGVRIGACAGTPAVVLTALLGGLIGAAVGAAVESALEALLQDMYQVAYYVHEEDVDVIAVDSYMANYLRQQYEIDPYRFVEQYGSKFDGLLHFDN